MANLMNLAQTITYKYKAIAISASIFYCVNIVYIDIIRGGLVFFAVICQSLFRQNVFN